MHAYLQNNVLELWSLFDFLMPGFLGTEKQFYERYGKPIIQSRDAKSSSKEQEAGLGIIIQILHTLFAYRCKECSCIQQFIVAMVNKLKHIIAWSKNKQHNM